ncbi:MAG: cytochrome c biogenesis protein CcsA [Ignavibacteriales bacterium]|nr:cytochrome c biogenesis protein CcsA [Ignavibacteriales bacterium]
MDIFIDVVNIVLPGLYVVVVWTYGKAFFGDLPWANAIKSHMLQSTLALHFLYIVARTIEFNHPPVTTIFEILTVLAFCVALAYLIIEIRTQSSETGYFILNIAFFFQFISSIFIRDLLQVPEVLRSSFFGLHVGSALLGYAAITISAVYGFLYLMLYHRIKASKFGVIYAKLPNLETLERMSYTGFKMAFLFLGIAILVGFLWLPQTFLEYSYSDPKLVGTILLWLLYGAGILAKRLGEWKGRRVMILSVCGFCITIFSMTIVNIWFTGFHTFY